MRRSAFVLVGLAIVAVGLGYFALTRGDPIADFLNKRWPPIGANQQRDRALTSAAHTLSVLSKPNFAVGLDSKTIEQFAEPHLRPFGITTLRVNSDRQLLRVEADFSRVFGPDDLPPNSEYRRLIDTLKPSISGTITVSVGVTSVAPAAEVTRIQLKLLPTFSGLQVKELKLAGKADVTTVGAGLAFLLNRYAENVIGAVNNLPILDVTFPASPFDKLDPTGLKVSIPSAPDVRVNLSGTPITFPFRVLGIAWLIADDKVIAIAQYIPKATQSPAQVTVGSSFDEVRAGVLGRLKDGLGIDKMPTGAWAAIGKELVADTLNGAFAEASPCISAAGLIPKQSFEKKVTLPDETTMDCTPTRDCTPKRDCSPTEDCSQHRECRKCVLGVCVNDPICESEKVIAKGKCEARKTARKLDCERLKSQDKLQCETEKSGQKALCETTKEGLKRISRTGKFANLEGSVGGPASLRVCFQNVDLARDLNSASMSLKINGAADLATHIKFVPLDIVGHLACQAPWTEDRTLKTTIPEQTLPIRLKLTRKTTGQMHAIDARIEQFAIKLKMHPGPTALILQSTNFALACAPLAGLINAVTLNLAPLIPELMQDFKYKQKEMDISFPLRLPHLTVDNHTIRTGLVETPSALILSGSI